MPAKKRDGCQIISARLPHVLIRRLDRSLDWSAFYRGVKSSRNVAMRKALQSWRDKHEQLAGFLERQAQRAQWQAAYRSVTGHLSVRLRWRH